MSATFSTPGSSGAGVAPVQSGARPAGYIVRHWRGELSLASSFWRGMVTAYLAIFAAMGLAAAVRHFADPIYNLAIAYATIVSVSPFCFAWWWIGGWRSAARTGSRWARVMQIVIIVLALAQVRSTVLFIPLVHAELGRVAGLLHG